MPDPTAPTVFIAELIWFGDNPVDGRNRVAVCTTLDAAVAALIEDDSDHPDLVATEVTDSALGTKTARTWAVHERGTEPDDEGHRWITGEPLQTNGTQVTDSERQTSEVPALRLPVRLAASPLATIIDADGAMIARACDREHGQTIVDALARLAEAGGLGSAT